MLINSTTAPNEKPEPNNAIRNERLLFALTSPDALRPIDTENKYFLLKSLTSRLADEVE